MPVGSPTPQQLYFRTIQLGAQVHHVYVVIDRESKKRAGGMRRGKRAKA